jgi:hypothetical protein
LGATNTSFLGDDLNPSSERTRRVDCVSLIKSSDSGLPSLPENGRSNLLFRMGEKHGRSDFLVSGKRRSA